MEKAQSSLQQGKNKATPESPLLIKAQFRSAFFVWLLRPHDYGKRKASAVHGAKEHREQEHQRQQERKNYF